jgi:hypothetical protein
MAMRSRTNMPFLAAIEVLIATTSGTASPGACGQAMTSTVTTSSTTGRPNPSATVQATVVTTAT